MRIGLTLIGVLAASLSMAATIAVTTPTVDSFLSRSNTVSFVLTGAVAQVTVSATAVSVTDPSVSITVSNRFTPTGNATLNGSLNLSFAAGLIQGPYTLQVTATEPGNFYNTPAPINVTVDTLNPKFIDFNPISGGFIRANVPITARFEETNMKEWRVRVDGAVFANNT
nr:hypothetical protein [Fimbriimonadaceae bacterium]